jgi:hypothetical protein
MGLLYHIVLLPISRQKVSAYLHNEARPILLDTCPFLERLILTNVLNARYTFLAYSVVIIVCVCYCRLLNIERTFYINARIS